MEYYWPSYHDFDYTKWNRAQVSAHLEDVEAATTCEELDGVVLELIELNIRSKIKGSIQKKALTKLLSRIL